MLPIGMLSSADYLDRQGYKVKIVNLAEKVVTDKNFNLEEYLSKLEANVFGIDLHWSVHSRGAIDTARLCKTYYPNSNVILGGLTATRFDQEIVSKYPWVDAVVRGEGEESIGMYIRKLERAGKLSDVQNLTYREADGTIRRNSLGRPIDDLNELCFTRLDLVEPNQRLMNVNLQHRTLKVWNLPVCRGCLFNCATCGGSAYSYKALHGRDRPAFIAPDKIVEEFQELDEQKVNSVFLFQDIRMGGEKYLKTLLEHLHKENWSHLEHVTLELFEEANEDFFGTLQKFKPTEKLGLTISPESGSEIVRAAHGRPYSNGLLLKTIRSSLDAGFSISAYFMIGLAKETLVSISETWKLWEKILKINQPETETVASIDFGPMILLDPGSLAFDRPKSTGYYLKSRTFQDYYNRMGLPSWKQWISYETDSLRVDDLVNIVFDSSRRFLDLFETFQFIPHDQSEQLKQRISLDKLVLREIDDILEMRDERQKEVRLNELKEIVEDPLLSFSYLLTHDV